MAPLWICDVCLSVCVCVCVDVCVKGCKWLLPAGLNPAGLKEDYGMCEAVGLSLFRQLTQVTYGHTPCPCLLQWTQWWVTF